MFLSLHVVTYFLPDCFRSVITIPVFQFPDPIWPRTLLAASRRASHSPLSRPPPTTRCPRHTRCRVTAQSQREWSQPRPTSRCRQTTTTRGHRAATRATRAPGPPRQSPITWAANFTVSFSVQRYISWVPLTSTFCHQLDLWEFPGDMSWREILSLLWLNQKLFGCKLNLGFLFAEFIVSVWRPLCLLKPSAFILGNSDTFCHPAVADGDCVYF